MTGQFTIGFGLSDAVGTQTFGLQGSGIQVAQTGYRANSGEANCSATIGADTAVPLGAVPATGAMRYCLQNQDAAAVLTLSLGFSGGGSGAKATCTLTGGVITAVAVTAGGAGYTSAPLVAVIPIGGTGAGAVLTATVAAGAVTGITIVNGGAGYGSAPALVVGTFALFTIGTIQPGEPYQGNAPGPLYLASTVASSAYAFTVAEP